MFTTTVGSTLFLLASAVVAQESVVSEIPSSLIQTTEGVFTIQTSVPTGTTTSCYEVCFQEPCYACSATPSDDQISLPVPSSISDGDVTLTLPVESLPPPVSLPVPISVSYGDVTMTLPVESLPTPSAGTLTQSPFPTVPITTDPLMSIPQGETPESTSVPATSSASRNTTVSASRSAPAEQSTAAAPPSLKGDSTPFVLALGISGVSVLLGAAWTLL